MTDTTGSPNIPLWSCTEALHYVPIFINITYYTPISYFTKDISVEESKIIRGWLNNQQQKLTLYDGLVLMDTFGFYHFPRVMVRGSGTDVT